MGAWLLHVLPNDGRRRAAPNKKRGAWPRFVGHPTDSGEVSTLEC